MSGKHFSRLLLSLFFFICILTGFFPVHAQQSAPEKEKYGGTLNIAIDREPKALDARYLGESSGDIVGHRRILERLTDYSQKGVAYQEPLLAQSWKQVDDLTWLVTIRKGVKYHNGKTLTARDVKKHFDWKIEVPQGWKPPRSRSRTYMLKEVELVDDYTLKFHLKTPFGPFVPLVLGWGLRGVGDSDQILESGKAIVTNPVGTGPFRLKEWVSGSHIVIEKFNDYWGRKAYLDRAVFKTIPDPQTRLLALQKGEVDVALVSYNAIPTIKKDPKLKYYRLARASGRTNGFLFNLRRWPMDQLKFRQAVAMGVDWNGIMKKVYPDAMEITRSYFKNSLAYNPKNEALLPAYNPEKATQLLKEVEAEAGKKIPSLYGVTRKAEPDNSFFQIVANQMKKIGLKVDVYVLEEEVMKDMVFRNPKVYWDVGLINLKAGGVHPIFAAQEFMTANNTAADGKNIMGYVNPEVESLVKQCMTISDPKKLLDIYQQLEKYVLKELPGIALFQEVYIWGVNKKVQDFIPHNSGYFYLTTPWCNIWLSKK
jgi:ABC-type transport system substrate-binding protein